MGEAFVGFYWTLPVNWRNFRTLSHDPEEAARQSRTIRYQLERVRRHVAEVPGGRLVDEVVFMDTRPDRATPAVQEALARVRRVCAEQDATVLLVEFDQQHFWRPNPYLTAYLREHGIRSEPLSPDALTVGGRLFEPTRHFREWRERDAHASARLQTQARAGLEAALASTPEGSGRYRRIAERLNADGIETARGNPWTAESVRKALTRGELTRLGVPEPQSLNAVLPDE